MLHLCRMFKSMAPPLCLLLTAGLSGATSSHAGGLLLASNGSTTYRVAGPSPSTPVDTYAVKLLAEALGEITGATFAIVEPGEVGPDAPAIFVGDSPAARSRLGANPLQDLGPQEHVVRTVGDSVFLYGEGAHGSLYAVTAFMEESLGWRWFSSFCKPMIPAKPTLVVAPIHRKLGFDFAFRQIGWRHHQPFKYQNGLNMGFRRIKDPQTGGLVEDPVFVNRKRDDSIRHTLFRYIPISPDHAEARTYEWLDRRDYFKTNPEFFSMEPGGKRVANMQLCLSNARLREELTRNILSHAALEPDAIITVEAADNPGRFCHCPSCDALERKYQSPGGPLYDYLLDLCGVLRERHPGVLVKMLAYRRSQTQKPPVMTDGRKFPDNMVVDFAPIEDCYFADWSHPDASIQETYEHLKGWRAVAERVWAWVYPNPWGTGGFVPVGNVRRLVTNLRLLHKAGVTGIFADHIGFTTRSAFAELQGYLMCRLMRDIDCDVDAVIAEFTDHHYGHAGELMRTYLDELEQCRLSMTTLPAGVTYKSHQFDDRTFPYLTAENIHRWQGYFDSMEQLTSTQPEALSHVRLARRQLDLAALHKWFDLRTRYPAEYVDHNRISDRFRAANLIKSSVGMPSLPLGDSALADFLVVIDAGGKVKPLPPQFAGVDPSRVMQFVPKNYARRGERMVRDADAAFGYAAVVDNPDLPLQVGFHQWISHQPPKGVEGARIAISAADVDAGGYRVHRLGRITVTPDSWIWFSAKSWQTHLRVGERLHQPGETNEWDAWVSIKADGPAYGGRAAENQVLVDRVILVQAIDTAAQPAAAAVSEAEHSDVHVSANLLTGGDMEQQGVTAGWEGNARRHTDDAHGGEASLRIDQPGGMGWAPGFVPIDPMKTYRLSGWMKSTNAAAPGRGLIDFRPFDADRKSIEPWTVRPVSGVARLLRPAAKGDRTIAVAEEWPTQGNLLAVALGVSGDVSDLPSRICHRVLRVRSVDGGREVDLVTALGEDWPAGSGAQLNRYLDYPRTFSDKVPAEWTYFSVVIRPLPADGKAARDTHWPGARFARIAILAQDVVDGTSAVLFDDVELAQVGE